MMRNLFWIFLLANVILFAAIQRGWLGSGEQEIQAQPNLHEEKIHLMPTQIPEPIPALTPLTAPLAQAPVGVSPAQTTSLPQSSSNLQLSRNMAASATTKLDAKCLEWGDFSGPDLARATAALSALQLGDRLSQRPIKRDVSYWVYIPPLKNKAAVHRKIAELKALHVKEYFAMQTPGHWLNAISLGVFKTRDAAENFLHGLQAKGVRTAQIEERGSMLKATLFTLNRVDAVTEGKLAALQKDFAGSELSHVPCALTSAH